MKIANNYPLKCVAVLALMILPGCGRVEQPATGYGGITPPGMVIASPTETEPDTQMPSLTDTPIPSTTSTIVPYGAYPLIPGPVINRENAGQIVLLGAVSEKNNSWRDGRQLVWSPDSREIAVASDGDGIRFVDPLEMKDTGGITEDNGEMVDNPGIVAYSGDGVSISATVQAGLSNGYIHINFWDSNTRKQNRENINVGAEIYTIDYSMNRKWMAVGSMHRVQVTDLDQTIEYFSFSMRNTQFIFVQFSDDNKYFAFSAYGIPMIVVNASSWTIEKEFGFESKGMICFSPDGKYLSIAPGIWSIDDYQLIATLEEDYSVAACDFGVQSDILINLKDDTEIQIWDVETKEKLLSFSEAEGCLNDLALSPDGHFIAAADSCKNEIKIWGVPAGSS